MVLWQVAHTESAQSERLGLDAGTSGGLYHPDCAGHRAKAVVMGFKVSKSNKASSSVGAGDVLTVKKATSPGKLLTVRELSEQYGAKAVEGIYKAIRERVLPAKRIGGAWHIKVSDFENWRGE